MTSREFKDRLANRAGTAGLDVTESVLQQLEEYVGLLAHWNSKVNLTSLAVRNPTDEAIDRLLIEPLAAANHFPVSVNAWVDLGSGGGSPAIPIKILRPSVHLTMVEAKARKAAFLREAVRVLQLSETMVENVRFEALPTHEGFRHRFDVVTVRAVKVDDNLFAAVHGLLSTRPRQGRLLMFQSHESSGAGPPRFAIVDTCRLLTEPRSYLVSLEPVAD